MGLEQNKAQEKKDRRGNKRGRKAAVGSSSHLDRGTVAWDELDNGIERELIGAVLGQGGAVMFSLSRDGGALGVRVYHDDHETETVWGRPDDGYAETLYRIIRYYEAYGEDGEQ